jgi:hypothetical protein
MLERGVMERGGVISELLEYCNLGGPPVDQLGR